MKSNLRIKEDVFDINLIFYVFLKKITQAKFTDMQILGLLQIYYSNESLSGEIIKEQFYSYIEEKIKRYDISNLEGLISDIDEHNLLIFVFALKLISIKGLLLEEAKITQNIEAEKLKGLNQLSLAYDKISTKVAYATRISGALLSLLFFEKLEAREANFLSEASNSYLESLIKEFEELKSKGLEANQIFMLLFSESINQSIISTAGASYEDRIRSVLISMGIPTASIFKVHDSADSSTEFDFFFEIDGRQYGIGAKRTLRERYKQFIKTAQMTKLDVMIEVTLGTDLRENIATSIRQHGVYLFIADEVYNSRDYLRKIEGIYPASTLSLSLLKSLK